MQLNLDIDALNTKENGIADIMDELYEALDFVINDEYRIDNTYKYGFEFKQITIKPFCVQKRFVSILGWGDRKNINYYKKYAEVNLGINLEQFITQTYEIKRLIIIDTIIKSIEIISENSIYDFKGKILIRDILERVNVKREQLLSLNKKRARA